MCLNQPLEIAVHASELHDFKRRGGEQFRRNHLRERRKIHRSRNRRNVGIFDNDVAQKCISRRARATRRRKTRGGNFFPQLAQILRFRGNAFRRFRVFGIRLRREKSFENFQFLSAGRRAHGNVIEKRKRKRKGTDKRTDAGGDFEFFPFFERGFVNLNRRFRLNGREFVHGNGIRQIVEQQFFSHLGIEFFGSRRFHFRDFRLRLSRNPDAVFFRGGNEVRERFPLRRARFGARRFRRKFARGETRFNFFLRERSDGLTVDEKHKFFHMKFGIFFEGIMRGYFFCIQNSERRGRDSGSPAILRSRHRRSKFEKS